MFGARPPVLLFIVCSFVTGWTALVMQSVWYRTVSALIGADARAQSFTIGCFLAGLAGGYYFWGTVARHQQPLRAYGRIELLLGIYALFFPFACGKLGNLLESMPASPLLDFGAVSLLVGTPAFLMGGTIPLLTAGLPRGIEDAPRVHRLVYGVNTLGGGAGILCGGLWLIPTVGLSTTLMICAVLNAGVYILSRQAGNDIEAAVPRATGGLKIADWECSPRVLLLLALVSGLTTIGLEVLMIRLLNVSAGPGVTSYPLIVGVFVIGLSLGPLFGRAQGDLLRVLRRSLLLALVFGAMAYYLIPWFSLWLNVLHEFVRRGRFLNSYEFSLAVSFLASALFLWPLLFHLGRVMPLLFELLPKTERNFPWICGRLYFINTLGCLLGAVGLGHFAFSFATLSAVFAFLVISWSMSYGLLLWEGGRRTLALVAVATVTGLVSSAPMDRSTFVFGLYERRSGLQPFELPGLDGELVSFREDPLGSVAVMKHPANRRMIPPFAQDPFFYTVILNGKPDGSTYADSLTTGFLGILPYLYHQGSDLRTAVVGYGTGLTAGILAASAEVASVDIVEISSALLASTPLLETQNMQPLSSAKSHIVDRDAFRFFSQRRGLFDIVVSEPSGQWVAGSDHLYTEEFYDRVQASLHSGGIFMNWLHLYNNDASGVMVVYEAMRRRFKHVRGYLLSGGADLGIMASNAPFGELKLAARFAEPPISKLAHFFSFTNPDDLNLNLILPGEDPFGGNPSLPQQTLDRPWLGYHAGRTRFVGNFFDLRNDPEFSHEGRLFHSSRRTATLLRVFDEKFGFLQNCADPGAQARNPACEYTAYLARRYRTWSLARPESPEKKAAADDLKRQGFFISDRQLVESSPPDLEEFPHGRSSPWAYNGVRSIR